MVPELLAGKWGYRICCVAHETTGGMSVERQQERDEEVMCVPEGLECLLPNAMVSGRINQHHAEKHDMTCDTARSRKMDLDGQLVANVFFLDVVEAEAVSEVMSRQIKRQNVLDIMSRRVDGGKNQQSIRDLAMKPCRLIEW